MLNMLSIKPYIAAMAIVMSLTTNTITPGMVSAKTTSTTLLSVFKPVTYLNNPTVINETTTTPENQALIDGERIQRLDNYFSHRDMPLAGHGAEFVEAAKKCKIDWRLLPAIGVRESSGGKHLMNNNPFGWGSAKIKFADFTDAIDGVSDNLCGLNPNTARYYGDKTTFERLWAYNGTVMPTYPKEVMDIMDMM